MPSPVRRSMRGAQPAAKPPPPASTSSSSSLSSSRQDRNIRVNSNPKSATPRSLSSEDTSEPPRRSQRSHPPKEEGPAKDNHDIDENAGEEEEVTRCICGQQEYPGPSLSEAFGAADAQSEDAGGLFISCDGCSVWQHGGCVGIIEESQVPDKYYCEECRPKQHELHTDPRGSEEVASVDKRRLRKAASLCHVIFSDARNAILRFAVHFILCTDFSKPFHTYSDSTMARYHETPTRAAAKNSENSQRYSLYQPVWTSTHRKGSVSKHSDKAQKERENTASRASADPATGRRRATMRSKEHDDEEEQIQRAIEESRREVEGAGNGRKSGKRVRDDSEDNKKGIKRQRTASESVPAIARRASADDESDEEPGSTTVSRVKKAKAEAAQSVRQAEQREKEQERERARAEAAGRRQERAGRRRADDEDETPNPSASAKTSPPPSSQPPSPPANAVPEKVSHKKGAGKKTKKLGNNQYTKHRDPQAQIAASSPHGRKRQLANNQSTSSGDEQLPNGDSHPTNTSNSTNKNSPDHPNGGKGKFGKGKGKGVNGNGAKQPPEDPAELTITKMKRRIDAMSAYVDKTKMELAADRTPSDSDAAKFKAEHASLAGMAGGAVQAPGDPPSSEPAAGRDFEGLSTTEMAEELSKKMANWKSLFGHLA